MTTDLTAFHTAVREERLFCAILYHLLLQDNRNLDTFVDSINAQLTPDRQLAHPGSAASIFVEFTYLRDDWKALDKNNDAKRSRIFELFSRSPVLRSLDPDSFPSASACGSFNERFMGLRGARIQSDIAFPGQWPVKELCRAFGNEPAVFRELCRFKWAFNIKPDLVIVAPGATSICVEAKLESREGTYPTSNEECAIFDEVFGPGNGRQNQVELQEFMLATLLGLPCETVTVGRDRFTGGGTFLSWAELFERLDLTGSIDFVRRLVQENRVLGH